MAEKPTPDPEQVENLGLSYLRSVAAYVKDIQGRREPDEDFDERFMRGVECVIGVPEKKTNAFRYSVTDFLVTLGIMRFGPKSNIMLNHAFEECVAIAAKSRSKTPSASPPTQSDSFDNLLRPMTEADAADDDDLPPGMFDDDDEIVL